jgi:hypothetical protein
VEWGDKEQWLRDIAAEDGKAPKALLAQPEIAPHLKTAWRAFWALVDDRQTGAMGGASGIPFTAIDRYAARYGVDDPDAFDRFAQRIRVIDAAYLLHKDKQTPEG